MKALIYFDTRYTILDRHHVWRSLDPTLDISSPFMKAFYLLFQIAIRYGDLMILRPSEFPFCEKKNDFIPHFWFASFLYKLLQVTRGYQRLLEVTRGYQRLPEVTRGYQRLPQVTTGYHRLPQITTGYHRFSFSFTST